MLREHSRAVAVAIFALLAADGAEAATIIDFEDWAGGSSDQTLVTSRGFNFASQAGLFVSPDPSGGNLTQSLHSRTYDGGTLTKIDGTAFSILSLDLHEGLPGHFATTVTLTGERAGGVVAKVKFTLDGLGNTYETFYPVAFSNIDSVTLSSDVWGTTFSLDNIVVPEPGVLGLILFGLAGILRRRGALI